MADISDREQFESGYKYRLESLDHWRSAQSNSSIENERLAVREFAIQASQNVRDNWGDKGRGPERLEHPEFDRGQRQAIMDWSHEHNHRLLTQERQRGRSAEAYGFGISF
jgi:hypothetical protein